MDSGHLKQLPIKNTKVAPGDVVGGLIYVMDKPVGVEEGMVGISVDSAPYREFIKGELLKLLFNGGEGIDPALKKRFDQIIKTDTEFNKALESAKKNVDDLQAMNHLIVLAMQEKEHLVKRYPLTGTDVTKIFFRFGRYHEVKAGRKYYQNIGMGGLLFSEYKKSLNITETDHFAKKIKKLTDNNEQVYMVKQDGVFEKGRTGPGYRRLLKTEVGKSFQILANPFIVLATGGLSLAGFAMLTGGWRRAILSRGTVSTVNSDAIVETLATKVANIRGFESQEMETIRGDYGKGKPPKIATIVTWSTGCEDMTGRLSGGEKDKTNVIVACDENKHPIKVDINNKIIRIIPDKADPKNPKKFKYFRGEKEVSKSTYDKAFSVSDDRVMGLGESLTSFICMGDRDGIGEMGQNKVLKHLIPPKGKHTLQFFGIDFGKAYEKKNPILKTLQDDFSFINPTARKERFLNVSVLYDNPLREKMKGIYLMAALRNKLTPEQKASIVKEYRDSGDVDFADKLEGYPDSLKSKYETELKSSPTSEQLWTQNGDLFLIKKEENEYRLKANKTSDPVERENYLAYAKRLSDIYKTAKETDDKVLEIFSKRMTLTPSQIDVIDNLEKLTAKRVHEFSPDGKVLLNHIRVENKDRTAWQIESVNNADNFRLTCDSTKPETILAKLKTVPGLEDQLNISNVTYKNNKLVLVITKEQLASISKILTEDKVAEARQLTHFRSADKKSEFHTQLNEPSKPENQSISVERQKKVSFNVNLETPRATVIPVFEAKRRKEEEHPAVKTNSKVRQPKP